MSIIGFYLDVVCTLDEIDAPYMLVGAFAASAFGLRRATFDVDILRETPCVTPSLSWTMARRPAN